MKKIFFIVFLTACTPKDINNSNLDLDMNVSFNEFKVLLKEYDKNKGFPNIDK